MGFRGQLRDALNWIVKGYGYQMVDQRYLYDWQKAMQSPPPPAPLPEGAKEYLSPGNQRLVELKARYAKLDMNVFAPLVWTESRFTAEDALYFRGNHGYVFQMDWQANLNVMGYALTSYYVKTIDRMGLLDKLHDDGLFGNIIFDIDKRKISRDLLESILEIYYLENKLGISGMKELKVLDIGAGYGRLAHRMAHALPNLGKFYCTDAFAQSTFISEYYLKFRQVDDKAVSVPVDEIEKTLASTEIGLAVNIHSFSECRLSAIEWWIALLAKYKIKYLMVVPNAGRKGGELLLNNSGEDFGSIIAKHGYRTLSRDFKYADPVVQKYGINPTFYHLFELS